MDGPFPDLPNRVFVYGSLKAGQPNHDHLMEGEKGVARFLGHARTTTAYPLVISTQWNIPFLLNVPGKGQLIIGEVYDVDDKCLVWLDKLEHYPELYAREYITVDLLSNDVTGSLSVSRSAASNIVTDEPVSNDVNGCVNPGQATCWVYFLKDFPPSMLELEMYSFYDSNGIHPVFRKTVGENILDELQQEARRCYEESQQL